MSLVESGSTAQDALQTALGPWGKRYTRTTTPSTLAEDLEAWLAKYKKLNDNLIKTNGDPLFRYVYVLFNFCPSRHRCSSNDPPPPPTPSSISILFDRNDSSFSLLS